MARRAASRCACAREKRIAETTEGKALVLPTPPSFPLSLSPRQLGRVAARTDLRARPADLRVSHRDSKSGSRCIDARTDSHAAASCSDSARTTSRHVFEGREYGACFHATSGLKISNWETDECLESRSRTAFIRWEIDLVEALSSAEAEMRAAMRSKYIGIGNVGMDALNSYVANSTSLARALRTWWSRASERGTTHVAVGMDGG